MRINEIILEDRDRKMPFADGYLVLSKHFEKDRSEERNIPASAVYNALHKLDIQRGQDLERMPFIPFVVRTHDFSIAMSKHKDFFGKIAYAVVTVHEDLHVGPDEDVIYLEDQDL